MEWMTHNDTITVGHATVKVETKEYVLAFTIIPCVYASAGTLNDAYTDAMGYISSITLTTFNLAVKNWNSGYNANVSNLKIFAIGY